MATNQRRHNPEVTSTRGRLGGLQRAVNRGRLSPDDPKYKEAETQFIIASVRHVISKVTHDEPLTKAQRIALIEALLSDTSPRMVTPETVTETSPGVVTITVKHEPDPPDKD